MAKVKTQSKRVQVDKSQATIVAIVASAVFLSVFSLVSAKSLWTQRSYQARVIGKKQDARDTLKANVESVSDLVASYQEFVGSGTNIIDGNPAGVGEKDGDNARIVLDALPSKYDFPAVTSSLEKILTEKNFKIEGIAGTDDEVAQSTTPESGTPAPVDIPFQLGVTGSYASVQDLIGVFEKSIRPFNIQKVTLSGSPAEMKMQLEVKTYYQPQKALSIKKEEVK